MKWHSKLGMRYLPWMKWNLFHFIYGSWLRCPTATVENTWCRWHLLVLSLHAPSSNCTLEAGPLSLSNFTFETSSKLHGVHGFDSGCARHFGPTPDDCCGGYRTWAAPWRRLRCMSALQTLTIIYSTIYMKMLKDEPSKNVSEYFNFLVMKCLGRVRVDALPGSSQLDAGYVWEWFIELRKITDVVRTWF